MFCKHAKWLYMSTITVRYPFIPVKHARRAKSTQIKAHTVESLYRSKRAAVISTCRDIYQNLALEDWIYDNVDVTDDSSLLIFWRNNPCVVIGRHQNPWAECDLRSASAHNISVARRRSGGGTVYHDLGNLNCTFVTSRRAYDRRRNLEVLAGAVRRVWGLDVRINDRDDLVLEDKYKISGTASKLGRSMAYHHCTLLCHVDTTVLKDVLTPTVPGLTSRATESVRSNVRNLSSANSTVTCDGLIRAISNEYDSSYGEQCDLEYTDPTNTKVYTDIHKLHHELKQWQWIYGKTPKFSVCRTFNGIDDKTLQISLTVEKGLISEASIDGLNLSSEDLSTINVLSEEIQNKMFWFKNRTMDTQILTSSSKSDFSKWVVSCLQQLVH